MKIAIDISPLSSGHSVRGVGFYLRHLIASLKRYVPHHEYMLFGDTAKIPPECDVVHYPYFDPFSSSLPAKTKHRTVVTVHDLTPLVFPEHFPSGLRGKLTWWSQREKLKKTDAIITDSHNSKKDIIKLTGISENKISVAYLAAGEEFVKINDEKFLRAVIKKYALPEKFILYVGDVTWNKNLPRLLHAMNNTDIPLVMVGKALADTDFDASNLWNKDLLDVQNLAKLNKNIHILGFIQTDELVALYNIATVFVFPSVYEGFGLPILEAMQCGTAVVTSREACLEEVAGNAAYYIDPTDAQGILAGIQQLWEDDDKRAEFEKAGVKQAKNFSWEKTAKETIAVYEKVASEIDK